MNDHSTITRRGLLRRLAGLVAAAAVTPILPGTRPALAAPSAALPALPPIPLFVSGEQPFQSTPWQLVDPLVFRFYPALRACVRAFEAGGGAYRERLVTILELFAEAAPEPAADLAESRAWLSQRHADAHADVARYRAELAGQDWDTLERALNLAAAAAAQAAYQTHLDLLAMPWQAGRVLSIPVVSAV